MTGPARHVVRFGLRAEPLLAAGVYAEGEVAVRLALQLAAAAVDDLRALRAATFARALVVLGPAERLPWVDGVTFVGACEDAPQLLVPTYCQPLAPAALVLRAIAPLQRSGQYLLLPATRRVIALGQAARVDGDELRAWAAAAGSAEPEPERECAP